MAQQNRATQTKPYLEDCTTLTEISINYLVVWLFCCLVVLLSGCFVVLLLVALAGSQYRAKRE